MGASVSIFLDERTLKENGLYPVKIRVTFKRQRRYYSLDVQKINSLLTDNEMERFKFPGLGAYSIDKHTFEKATGEAPRGVYKRLKDIFTAIEIEYQQRANQIIPFSFDRFAGAMKEKPKPGNDVFKMMDNRITELENEGRVGYAISFSCCLKSLKKFTGKDSARFEFFTADTLKKYEKWMLSKDNGNSSTTVGIYLRTLRAVFNDARKSGVTGHYPFGSEGYQIPSGKGRKIALAKDEIKKLLEYKLPDKDPHVIYFDIWKLSYMMSGINVKDLVLLKRKDIQGDFIHFIREKTKRTAKEPPVIKIYLSDPVKEILKVWEPASNAGYLLPILTGKETEKEIKRTVNNLIRTTNEAMKTISGILEISKTVTTYTARHTWATGLMRSGAPVTFIQKQLGHMNSSTTDGYLSEFTEDDIIEWNKKLNEL